MINVEKILERKRKEYQEQITETEMLSQMLMNKDKKELVGIIIGIIMSGGLK